MTGTSMPAIRICFIGDSITVGTGDETMLGWPGRVCAGARAAGHDVTVYNLGVRGETSEHIRSRWRAEAGQRLPVDMNCALVFAFGLNDCAIENQVRRRVEPERTVANARAILTEAKAWLPSIFIGPTPVDDTRLPAQLTPGKEVRIFNTQVAAANRALARVAAEVGVPFLDLFTPLTAQAEWRNLMRRGDGIHPPARGYEWIAQLVEEWKPWRDLLGQSPGA